MSRLILNIDDSIEPADALYYAQRVAAGGRVSKTAGKEHYACMSVFKNGVRVWASITRNGTDTMRVYRGPKP